MTSGEVGFWRVSGAGAAFGCKLMRVDMDEVEMSTFVGTDVVKPRMVRWMRSRGKSGFEGLEVKGVKIIYRVRGRDAGMKEAGGIIVNSSNNNKK